MLIKKKTKVETKAVAKKDTLPKPWRLAVQAGLPEGLAIEMAKLYPGKKVEVRKPTPTDPILFVDGEVIGGYKLLWLENKVFKKLPQELQQEVKALIAPKVTPES